MSSDKVKEVILKEEMESSYIDYAMSVVIGRAIPDVRDGFKPVHRKIIYAMVDNNYVYNRPHVKSARTVGETLGKYHPHGDMAVYNALVRMGQDFSLRYPLIDPQGNFGSIDGDPPAAMRYCITGDSLVLTGNGFIPIKELSENVREYPATMKRKNIHDRVDNKKEESGKIKNLQSIISEGHESDIEIEILSYRNIINKASRFFDSGIHDIIEVVTNLGFSIKGSKNHPILCWTTDSYGKPITAWKTLEMLSKDDILILQRKGLYPKQNYNTERHIPKETEKGREVKFPKEITEELAFCLGALMAGGTIIKTDQQRLSFNNTDFNYYEKVKNGLLRCFPGISLHERPEHDGMKEFSLHSLDVLDFLYSIGLHPAKSDDKEIPFSILRSSKSVIATFLQGLFESDGSIVLPKDARHGGRASNFTYISKSVKLINQLKYLLLSFGIITSHIMNDSRNGTYRISILGMESKLIFAEEIGFFSSRKAEKIEALRKFNPTSSNNTDFIPYLSDYFKRKYGCRSNEHLQKQNIDRYSSLRMNIDYIRDLVETSDALFLDQIMEDHYLFQKIISINQLPKEHVYSIRVDSDCHSFTANGFINHNTEARLAQITNEMVEDLDKETVEFQPNFDESLLEPKVLPSKLPNMLINGTKGIAVGMATSMPPHNLTEICNGIIATIDNPDISLEELMEFIKGPDFPTGGVINSIDGIYNAYSTGQGSIPVYGKIEIEQKGQKYNMLITEIPYLVNKAALMESIADLIKEGIIKDVRDLRDESDRHGMRIVLELKKDAQPSIIKNILFKRTRLLTNFNVINLVLINDGKQPKILTLKDLIQEYINHRLTIIVKRTEYDLKKSQDRLHIVEGLLIALNDIDNVIAMIKGSKDAEEARIKLIDTYKLSENQVKAILSMPLSRLTNLEQQKLVDEKDALKNKIKELENILNNKSVRLSIIKEELNELIKKYGDPRKTEILESKKLEIDLEKKDLIKKEPTIVLLTKNHYIKRMLPEQYRAQARGGRGKKGMTVRNEDFIQDLFVASTHDMILFFTNKGRVYCIKCFEIPLQQRTSKGKPIVNLLPLKANEDISEMIPIHNFDSNDMLIMVTKNGIVKKTRLNLFSKVLKTGIRAQKIREDDQLVSVRKLSNELQDIFLATKKGYAIRFDETELRELGRNTMGVKGADLRKGDEIIECLLVSDEEDIITLTNNGKAQRTKVEEYRKTGRGAKGVINMTLEENDEIIALKLAEDQDILIGTEQGQVIRTPIYDIRLTHRKSKGVRVIKLYKGDSVVAIGTCAKSVEE